MEIMDTLKTAAGRQELLRFERSIPKTSNAHADLGPTTIVEAFGHALLNFNHFTATETAIDSSTLPERLHNHLRQSAALQLVYGQTDYDLLIPT
jgi:hypothetical protein